MAIEDGLAGALKRALMERRPAFNSDEDTDNEDKEESDDEWDD